MISPIIQGIIDELEIRFPTAPVGMMARYGDSLYFGKLECGWVLLENKMSDDEENEKDDS